jgi:hypothetical protein
VVRRDAARSATGAARAERAELLEQKLSERISGVEQKIAAVDARLLRWMIGLWIVTLSAMGVLRIVR